MRSNRLFKFGAKILYKVWLRLYIPLFVRKPKISLPYVQFSGQTFKDSCDKLLLDDRIMSSFLSDFSSVLSGKIPIFDDWVYQLPQTSFWLTDPRTKFTYPQRHWTKLKVPPSVDVKFVWEINRLENLDISMVALATSEEPDHISRVLDYIDETLNQWSVENPYNLGANWNSNAEVAMRLQKFLLIRGLITESQSVHNLRNILDQLISEHYTHVKTNIVWTKLTMGNSHYLVELAALAHFEAAIGRGNRWLSELINQAKLQFFDDGGNCEGSLNYHVYSLDTLAFTRMCLRMWGGDFTGLDDIVSNGFYFLSSITRKTGRLPKIGDWDEGRAFKPIRIQPDDMRPFFDFYGYAEHNTTEGWQILRDFGLAVCTISLGGTQFVVCLKAGNVAAGHSHIDLLSIYIYSKEIFSISEAGVFQYGGSGSLRDFERSQLAHSTLISNSGSPLKALTRFSWRGALHCELKQLSEEAISAKFTCPKTGNVFRRQVTVFDNHLELDDFCDSKEGYQIQFICPTVQSQSEQEKQPSSFYNPSKSITLQNQGFSIEPATISHRYGKQIDAVRMFKFVDANNNHCKTYIS